MRTDALRQRAICFSSAKSTHDRHLSAIVHCVDGEIGRVEGFIVSPADHRVTHVLLQECHLWGRRQVAIPVSAVASVDAGIRLNITKKQVEDLPRVDPAG